MSEGANATSTLRKSSMNHLNYAMTCNGHYLYIYLFIYQVALSKMNFYKIRQPEQTIISFICVKVVICQHCRLRNAETALFITSEPEQSSTRPNCPVRYSYLSVSA